MVNLIVDKLKEPSIKNDEKLKLEKEYYEAKMKWDDLTVKYNIQYRDYIKIRKGRDNAKIELDLLLKNQKRIRAHNAKGGVKTGPSPNSCYNLDILKGQIDHIPKEIESLLAELEGIKADKDRSKDSLKTWKAEYNDRMRRRKKQCEIVKVILREHEQNQPIGAQVREFINLLLPNARVE
ncbi:hypothetical protein BASA83_004474 [Batrachochytrium salamandrivorans]|nr:hypothetical protein BASA83_004474 [Batrachochytrium salamandrivorans]